jgi:hypothetical protein
MADFIIPCDTVRRLANVAAKTAVENFHCIRLDNGTAVASDTKIMAVERIGDFTGVAHLLLDETLVKQCEIEAPFKSVLTITAIDAIKYATAKTTLGYVHPANCVLWSDEATRFDCWREVVKAEQGKGGRAMFWNCDTIARLGKSSPSGCVVFPAKIDIKKPIIIRDYYDPSWFGVFAADDADATPAILPDWFK